MIVKMAISQKVCDIITEVCQGLANFLSWLLGLLPDDPLDLNSLLSPPQGVKEVLAWVNWLIPLRVMVSMIATWFAAIMLFQVLRFGFKALQLI